jgi:hypothetical protein
MQILGYFPLSFSLINTCFVRKLALLPSSGVTEISFIQWTQLIRLYNFIWWWKQSQLPKCCVCFKLICQGKCPRICITLMPSNVFVVVYASILAYACSSLGKMFLFKGTGSLSLMHPFMMKCTINFRTELIVPLHLKWNVETQLITFPACYM